MVPDSRIAEILARAAAPGAPGEPAHWLPRALLAAPGLGALLDHTLLRPDATAAEIRRLAAEGRQLGTASVCVNGRWIPLVAEVLGGSATVPCAVVGFPLGAGAPAAKAAEAALAVAQGAREVDMVLSLGDVKGAAWEAVRDDIRAVVEAAAAPVKVILESALLTPDEIVRASLAAVEAGAAFVKTSTGFHASGGASVEAVRLMRTTVGTACGVKASGGVRSAADVLRMVRAGASRIGTSGAAGMAAAIGAGAPALAALLAAREAAVPPGAAGGY